MNCGEIQDRMPDRVAGRVSAAEAEAVDRHLAGCAECRAVHEAVQFLAATPPAVPPGLQDRILAAVRADRAGSGEGRFPVHLRAEDRGSAGPEPFPSASGTKDRSSGGRSARSWWPPAWGWALAAGIALAVGIPVLTAPDSTEPEAVEALAFVDDGVGEVWLDDDLMVAGAPAVSELSDEVLAALLEEFER